MFIDKSMTKKVVTVGPNDGILETRELLAKSSFRHLPVVDEENRLVGIVTDRDIRSAMPSVFLDENETLKERERLAQMKIKDIMTKNPVTVNPANTLEDAILLMQRMRVGAFPVVDREGKLRGMLSIRDLVRAFVNVLGLEEPGTLLCIKVQERVGEMKKIVDAITEEHISFGSILVSRYWEEGKRAVFPYLLTTNVAHVKRKLVEMGYELIDPMEWTLDALPRPE
ncbi:CBS domain-containing protein [Syntrophobacter fumaroxidans]|uniref:CBS domain containing membrane protein n=1 Tax=Syntrophobacter fumaroxidans (strain DSM 10017 / MPOB) TaxID=335543 RepID=A0LGS9_SYNFM|nr:CBS domain-containing protein [Syntrophobacter fumaroxidans]ABK16631.1 CBS domain containing membrane protein [Syntrophobacter fumaroxidans MPOB]